MYLNCHTYHSLRYGTLPPETLVAQARAHGLEQLALTDINNSSAMPEFVRLCRQQGIDPVAGVEFRRGDRLLYIVLARNPEGFRRINQLLSRCNASGTPPPERFPVCEETFAIYPLASAKAIEEDPGPHEYTGIRPRELLRLERERKGPAGAALREDRLLALHPVSLSGPSDFDLHCHLRAIDHNILLSRLQPGQTGTPTDHMLPPAALERLYEGMPQLLRNTTRLLQACRMDFDFGSPKNKRTFTGDPADDRALLQKLAREGMEYRYGKKHREAQRRISHELEVIDRLGFSSYFLITWDIIRYSMSRGFYHVGRGSGANSIVAYCLRITDVDPIELDLYFERFINPKRSTPPDFDIDYSWKERDEVLDYIFKRYGREHTALIGTVSTFRDRSMIRELGKAYGLPKAEIDSLAGRRGEWLSPGRDDAPDEDLSGMNGWPGRELSRGPGGPAVRLQSPASGPDLSDAITHRIRQVALRLADFPNMRSIHAGGVLISEQPICCYGALDMPPKGLPTMQWDMYTAEALGFEKIDILSQRGLGHINECVAIIRQNHGTAIDIHRIGAFKQDEKVKALLRAGETTGCFYVESPAMRGLLRKLRCDTYTALVAASSIIRPGVARSGMMREYIQRFHNPEGFRYLHPVMEQQLKETYGVMVYQEDVIKVCHHFAGLDLGDADVLRRAMSGKYRSKKEMQRIVARFFEGSREKGHPGPLIREVWRQIESFAGYSFSKAHSASFAVESYQSLYLKAHHPLEFMTAVINNFGGFYRAPVYFNEARRCGAAVELPCVNHSRYKTSITGRTIHIGFVHVLNLEAGLAHGIVAERRLQGPYLGLEDFCKRTGAGLEQLILLIRSGALRFTGIPKARLLWQAHLLAGREAGASPELFPVPARRFDLPEPETTPLQDAWDEIELLGFPVSMSLFDMLQTRFRGEIMARDMTDNQGKTVRMLGWLVAIKYVKTVRNERMYFGCFLDCRGDFFDSVHFPAASRASPFRGNGIYLLKGRVVQEFGFPSLEVEKMARMPVRPGQ